MTRAGVTAAGFVAIWGIGHRSRPKPAFGGKSRPRVNASVAALTATTIAAALDVRF
jgi:hypothetical protein